jgi:hypothetical protein
MNAMRRVSCSRAGLHNGGRLPAVRRPVDNVLREQSDMPSITTPTSDVTAAQIVLTMPYGHSAVLG